MTPRGRRIGGLSEIASRYETVLVDLWGTIHDGFTVYPEALAAVQHLRAAGLQVGLLSNAPRPAAFESDRLERLGMAPRAYTAIFTAGETWRGWWRGHGGGPIVHCGMEGNLSLFDGLEAVLVDDPDAASVVVVSDLDPRLGAIGNHRGLLEAALARDLPLHCINPDRRAVVPGGEVPRGGAVGHLYAGMGGRVSWFGKPASIAYKTALAGLGQPRPARVLCIGDNLETDIAGALQAGLGAALVLTGRTAPAGAVPDGCVVLDALRW